MTAASDVLPDLAAVADLPDLTAAGDGTATSPRATVEASASWPATSGTGTHRAHTRTHARAIKPEDKAIAEAASLALQAQTRRVVATVQTSARVVAMRLPTPRAVSRALLIAGGESASAPTLVVPRARYHGKRGLVAGLVAIALCLSVLVGILRAVRTFSGVPNAAVPLELAAAGQAVHPYNPIPAGPWDTGASDLLGVGGGAGPGVSAPGSAGLPVKTAAPTGGAQPGAVPLSEISPAPVSPWPPSYAYMAVPGHSSFAVSYPSDGFYGWAFGQCTWWAQDQRRDENLTHMGNAQYWASSAAGRGYKVSSTPRRNATVVFQPGVQGAGGAGHVGHVIAVYPDGWFLVSEMNYYWNGGGWARVDYRFAHDGPGVQFIY